MSFVSKAISGIGDVFGGLLGGGSSSPAPAPAPIIIPSNPSAPVAPPPPAVLQPQAASSAARQRAKAASAAGQTLATSAVGLTETAKTGKKTLLGE